MLKKELVILSNIFDNPTLKENVYLTFSKTKYKKYQNKYNIKYFFDIDPKINEHEELNLLERNLFEESKENKKRWFSLPFKFIYKYLITYNQFYNRLETYIKDNNNIKSIESSKNNSFIFKSVIVNLTEKYDIESILNSKKVDSFSYRHSAYMASDIPKYKDIDKNNIFIKLHSFYLRIKNHKTFIFPSSIDNDFPKKVNLFRISLFTVYAKIKRLLNFTKNRNYLRHTTIIDFSFDVDIVYCLNDKIWSNYRNDQIKLIETILNIYFYNYKYEYLDAIQGKIECYLQSSRTQKVILDETIDSFRRLMCLTCKKIGIKTEFTPHGIIDEKLQFPLTDNMEYKKKYIPNVLAWNNSSSEYFVNQNINSRAISYPIVIYPHKVDQKKDILVMLSYGDRINLNAFEDYIIDLLPLQIEKKYTMDWKIHQNIFEESNLSMKIQKDFIEKEYNTKINFLKHDIKATSILKNYKTIIFTTWTTGIYEAALLNVPFVIYTKENEIIRGLDNIRLPIAENLNQLHKLIEHNNKDYLFEIKDSLTANIKLDSYLQI